MDMLSQIWVVKITTSGEFAAHLTVTKIDVKCGKAPTNYLIKFKYVKNHQTLYCDRLFINGIKNIKWDINISGSK